MRDAHYDRERPVLLLTNITYVYTSQSGKTTIMWLPCTDVSTVLIVGSMCVFMHQASTIGVILAGRSIISTGGYRGRSSPGYSFVPQTASPDTI